MMTPKAMRPFKMLVAGGIALLMWGLVFAYAPSSAQAATLTVNTLADDADPDDGECTLREAITSANSDTASGTATGECEAGSGADIIDFALPGTAPWKVNLSAELPALTSNVEIDGPGDGRLTVTRPDTAENFRIFTVSGDTTVVTIRGMTISNGYVDDNTEGGGILIADSGTLTVTGSTITGNFTEDGGGGIGIDRNTRGTLTVTGSTISGNTAEFDDGGGIRNAGDGTVKVTDSTIRNNFSGHGGGALSNDGDGTMTAAGSTIGPGNFSDSEGGGIYNGGTLRLTACTIRGNSTDSDGGGVYNSGNMTVADSTISGNTSGPSRFGGEGGGISSSTDLPDADPSNDPDDTTTITNSTISGNTAAGDDATGGGVYNSFGLTVIENSTVTDNTAPDGRGSGVASRGNEEYASTEVHSSIISANTNTDVDFLADFGTPTNTFVSGGHNLIGDGNATGAFDQTGDQVGKDPLLGPLADNGGPTETHALLAGSPAIDAIPRGTNGCGRTPTEDQRGVERPQGSACDIGSFENRDTTAPRVTSVSPAAGATGVGRATNAVVTFSEKMDKSTINRSTFRLFRCTYTSRTGCINRVDVANVAISKSEDGLRATLNPYGSSSSLLAPNAKYEVLVSPGVTDVAGNALDQNPGTPGNQGKRWTFTTGG